MYTVLCFVLLYIRDVGVGWGGGGGGMSCFHGHLNKCPLGDLNKSPWEIYLEGGGSEEIIKSTRFCKVHYVLNSDIKSTTVQLLKFMSVLLIPNFFAGSI
jgi:hypothetical protein